jgi:hypothetical protein
MTPTKGKCGTATTVTGWIAGLFNLLSLKHCSSDIQKIEKAVGCLADDIKRYGGWTPNNFFLGWEGYGGIWELEPTNGHERKEEVEVSLVLFVDGVMYCTVSLVLS